MVGENLNQNFFFHCKNSWLNSYLIEEKNEPIKNTKILPEF